MQHEFDTSRPYKVLIADPVGLAGGDKSHLDVQSHIHARAGVFHPGPINPAETLEAAKVHFFYQPDLSTGEEILSRTAHGEYDAIIAAATPIPAASRFTCGGVRIGAGTNNMMSASWGGPSGIGGTAPLMNTPGINSRATAQMAFKALLRVRPDIPTRILHDRVLAGTFDTGRHLAAFPTHKLEGCRLAILGFGNIGRQMACLGQAFGMDVAVYARERHKPWIESEGFTFAATPRQAVQGADVVSVHLGLGHFDPATGTFANAGLVDAGLLNAVADGATLINYDRGELVEIAALDAALCAGKVRHALLDADIFVDDAGAITGPLAPYRDLAHRYPDRLELLPHAAADTDHPSRVAGAKQAVDQLMDAIQLGRVANVKGDLPEEYVDAGPIHIRHVTPLNAADIADIVSDEALLGELARTAALAADGWQKLLDQPDRSSREALLRAEGEKLVLGSNRYAALIRQYGLSGRFSD